MTWSVINDSDAEIILDDAWVPHGRFRGDGHIPLGFALIAAQSTDLSLDVTADEPVGTVVENAFLILRAHSGANAWRVFTRMHIEFATNGIRPVIDSVTTMSSNDT